MKKRFHEHFKPDDDQVTDIWKNAIFCLDTNTLLNLYRYSDATRKDFMDALQKLKGRIWLADHAAREFFKNRAAEIVRQSETYNKVKKSIVSLEEELSKTRGHPHLNADTLKALTETLDAVKEELTRNQEEHKQRISRDDVLQFISMIVGDKVTPQYTPDELEAVFDEGVERYSLKTPPGYKDAVKAADANTLTEKLSIYGDLIIWKQMMDLSAKEGKPIIFVTDDAKEDWWLEVSGLTVGARPELISEFTRQTSHRYLQYRPESFLELANSQMATKVSDSSLDEVRRVQQAWAKKPKRSSTLAEGAAVNFFAKYRPRRFPDPLTRSIASESREGGEWSRLEAEEYKASKAQVEQLSMEVSFIRDEIRSLKERNAKGLVSEDEYDVAMRALVDREGETHRDLISASIHLSMLPRNPDD